MKDRGVFWSAPLLARIRENIARYPWAMQVRDGITAAAEPWLELSDDHLWDMIFGNTITRSWMVWSNGHCPSCQGPTPMYTWQIAALEHPWKVRCPHCGEFFPKNDFAQFYRSGLDEHGVFDPGRADRALLRNEEHPDPSDPLHHFGVDDGEGYVETGKRWRFIGAYLIYGQWKQAILGGIRNLASAYVLTGDRDYAHKAGVLLDRVADLYPTFDFGREGTVYEQRGLTGYVSTWHDACEETRELALAYDQVFDALSEDEELVAFLRQRAAAYGLHNPKATFADIQRNIEGGILRDALLNEGKIRSNYPRTEVAKLVIHTVLDWPAGRERVGEILDGVLQQATAIDGVTGEKGLAAYSAYVIQGLAVLLSQYTRLDPGFLPSLLRRHPRVHDMYRFHIDTWCLQGYYPRIGDTGAFATRSEQYVGVLFSRQIGLEPSMFSFLWQLYELTGDEAFVQVLYHANGDTVDNLPYDLCATDPGLFQARVAEVIGRVGPVPVLGSVNKEQWHLGILRSGRESERRALWLAYDCGGRHSHFDGMTLGLFAKGLDLLPDFGYIPVQYGGWDSPRTFWYRMTAAHNTVTVDGGNQRNGVARTTLWVDNPGFQVIRVSGPELIAGQQYERTAMLIDVSESEFYVLDLFRVVGGQEHTKFLYSHFGQLSTEGLALREADDYGRGTEMCHFRADPSAQPGWSVEWQVEDRYRYLPAGTDLSLRYTDCTLDAEAGTAEAWISVGGFTGYEEAWIPCVLVRRRATTGVLASTFVGVLEPYARHPRIARVRRLPLQDGQGRPYADSSVAVEMQFDDGQCDLVISVDVENPLGHAPAWDPSSVVVQEAWDVRLWGESCWVRRDASGQIRRAVMCGGPSISIKGMAVDLTDSVHWAEIAYERGRGVLVRSR